jgi:Fic family protein
MRASDFKAPQTGEIVRSWRGHDAFVPAPLPPTIEYDENLVSALSEADTALSELSGLGKLLPNPNLLISPYLRREAVLSSRIEGTRAGLTDVLLDEIDEKSESDSEAADVQEIRNYVDALEFGIQAIRERPFLTLELTKALHLRLMSGVRGQNKSPGMFRKEQNWIGGRTIETAVYVPPPPERLDECLSAWERFANVPGTIPPLIQCALMHEQFEAIHPFNDGNGRLGRLLITLFLINRGRLSHPLLYLSDYIEAHKEDYYDLLQRVRTDGDWRSWIVYFLEGVRATARQAAGMTEELLRLREFFRQVVSDKPKALALVDHLYINPFVTSQTARSLLGVTAPTARSVIATLEQAGILSEYNDRSYRRVYVCRPILTAIEVARMV